MLGMVPKAAKTFHGSLIKTVTRSHFLKCPFTDPLGRQRTHFVLQGFSRVLFTRR
jgi:hypothetical protein